MLSTVSKVIKRNNNVNDATRHTNAISIFPYKIRKPNLKLITDIQWFSAKAARLLSFWLG
jgi:hypothetical protein